MIALSAGDPCRRCGEAPGREPGRGEFGGTPKGGAWDMGVILPRAGIDDQGGRLRFPRCSAAGQGGRRFPTDTGEALASALPRWSGPLSSGVGDGT
ncbi:hypothetical protein GCM10009551_025410 [Nocardiopsis tropica]